MLGVLHIRSCVCYLPVAADDEFAALVAHFLQVIAEHLEELGLARLLFGIARIGGGSQETSDAQILVICLDVAPLHIEIGEAQSGHDGLGQFPAIERDPICLAVDVVKKIGVVVLGKENLVLQVIFGASQVLDAYEVGILFTQPVIKSLFRGGPDAVGTETDDPHSWSLLIRGV